MPIEGEYQPSPEQWVRNQVERYESSNGQEGTTLRGVPVIILITRGVKSGKVRKVPLMRVEHAGVYAVVASRGGAPDHPLWYRNLLADPHVELRDRADVHELTARELDGEERSAWWDRAVSVWPDYAEYQKKTDRQIPVFALEPKA